MAFNIKPILGKPRKLARISALQKGYARDLPRREPPWHLLKSKRAKFKLIAPETDEKLTAAFRAEEQAKAEYFKKLGRKRKAFAKRKPTKEPKRKPETRTERLLPGEGPTPRASKVQGRKSQGSVRTRETLEPLTKQEFSYLKNLAQRIRGGETLNPQELDHARGLVKRLMRQRANSRREGEGYPSTRISSRSNEANKRLAEAERAARTDPREGIEPSEVLKTELKGGLGNERVPLISQEQAQNLISSGARGTAMSKEVEALSGRMSPEQREQYGAEKLRKQTREDLRYQPVSSALKPDRGLKFARKKSEGKIQQIFDDSSLSDLERVQEIEKLFEDYVQNNRNALIMRGKLGKVSKEDFALARKDTGNMLDLFVDSMMSLGNEGEAAVRRLFNRDRVNPSQVFSAENLDISMPEAGTRKVSRELNPWHEGSNMAKGWIDRKKYFFNKNEEAIQLGDVSSKALRAYDDPSSQSLFRRTFIAGNDPRQTRVQTERVETPRKFLRRIFEPGVARPRNVVQIQQASKIGGTAQSMDPEASLLETLRDQYGNIIAGDPIKKPLYTRFDPEASEVSPPTTKEMLIPGPSGQPVRANVDVIRFPGEDMKALGIPENATWPEMRALADEQAQRQMSFGATPKTGLGPLRKIMEIPELSDFISAESRRNPPSTKKFLDNRNRFVEEILKKHGGDAKAAEKQIKYLDRLLRIAKSKRFSTRFQKKDLTVKTDVQNAMEGLSTPKVRQLMETPEGRQRVFQRLNELFKGDTQAIMNALTGIMSQQ